MIVKFSPKADDIEIQVEKCNHRYGAVMTFSHQTDARYESSIYASELYGFKNNVRLGAFISNTITQDNSNISDVENTGLIKHDIYFGTDVWLNPSTNNVERIPDYYSTTWSSDGVSFFNVVEGETKTTKYPNHGQQMYDLSNGVYGFDFINSVYGTSNLAELKGVADKQQELIKTLGKTASAGSYRNGVRNAEELMPLYLLGVRNSSENHAGLSETYYGSGLGFNNTGVTDIRQYFRNYASSTRWWDTFTYTDDTKEYMNTYVDSEIKKTVLNNGWYRDFCHWHNLRNNEVLPELDEFLQIVRSAFESNFVWTCSNGEALGYMFLREITKTVVAKATEDKVYIITDVVDNYKDVLVNNIEQSTHLEQINTPLSVRIDLSNTFLSGKNVKSNYGKSRSLGNDVYIVEVPFDFKEHFKVIYLEEKDNGIFNESVPTGTATISNGVLTVNTDMLCKMVLYGADTGSNEYDFLPIERNHNYKYNNTFNIEDGKDYKIGIISEFNQANLITV